MESQILIGTEKSFLSSTIFTDIGLLRNCVKSIKTQLDETPEIIVFGRVVKQRRDVSLFSDTSIGYFYAGKLAPSKPLTEKLGKLLRRVNRIFDAEFNGILINRYNNGDDYIGAHSDDERNLDPIGVVAISVGASRKFRIRDKVTKQIVDDFYTHDNEILHMGGDFQKEFTHEIPKERTVFDTRYSFTFRKHIE